MKVVNGKLLLQEYESVHIHTRNNAVVADFVKSGQLFSFERLPLAIAQFQEVSRHKVVISIGNGFVFLSCTAVNSAETVVKSSMKEFAFVVSTVAFPKVN